MKFIGPEFTSDTVFVNSFAIFSPLSKTPIHQRSPDVIPLQEGTYAQLQRKLQSVINVREVAFP